MTLDYFSWLCIVTRESLAAHGAKIAELYGRVERLEQTLERRFDHLDNQLDGVRETIAEARGGWKLATRLMGVVGAVAGALATFGVTRLNGR